MKHIYYNGHILIAFHDIRRSFPNYQNGSYSACWSLFNHQSNSSFKYYELCSRAPRWTKTWNNCESFINLRRSPCLTPKSSGISANKQHAASNVRKPPIAEAFSFWRFRTFCSTDSTSRLLLSFIILTKSRTHWYRRLGADRIICSASNKYIWSDGSQSHILSRRAAGH